MIFWWRLGDHYSGVRRSIGCPAVFFSYALVARDGQVVHRHDMAGFSCMWEVGPNFGGRLTE
jgi:hypothetical protein